jgi:hypothetical protein
MSVAVATARLRWLSLPKEAPMKLFNYLTRKTSDEEGHAYAWSGGGLFTIFLIVLILIVLF